MTDDTVDGADITTTRHSAHAHLPRAAAVAVTAALWRDVATSRCHRRASLPQLALFDILTQRVLAMANPFGRIARLASPNTTISFVAAGMTLFAVTDYLRMQHARCWQTLPPHLPLASFPTRLRLPTTSSN